MSNRIVYKPHCEKCGAIINENITYRYILYNISPTLLEGRHTEIFPEKCKCCGEPFEVIEVRLPEELPTERLL